MTAPTNEFEERVLALGVEVTPPPRYLDDVPEPPAPKRSWRPFAAVFLALALIGSGFLVGRATRTDGADPSTTLEASQQAATTVNPPVATTPSTLPPVEAAPPATTPPVPDDAVEPVAAVAAAVGPSVVQLTTGTGTGSGVIYHQDGYILTAAHVVDGSNTVQVGLADGRFEEGVVLGTHEPSDVAVVKIDDIGDLPIASLGVGLELQVGQLAVALGFPFGLEQTVTAGIISAVNTTQVNGIAMVQTDAAINPGNSGGPLVDRNGHVIGINDIIFTQGGGNDGVGFAISIDVAKVIADQIVAGEQPQLALLGVSTTSNTNGQGGATVMSVVEGSAAQEAGIEVGDLIVSVDGVAVLDSGELRARIISKRPGSVAEIGIIRDGSSLILRATLGGTDG
jgi:S1-C subfamily serine protease